MIVAEKNSAVWKAFCRYGPVTSFRGNLRLNKGRRERKERKGSKDKNRGKRGKNERRWRSGNLQNQMRRRRASLVTRTRRITGGLRLHLGEHIPKTGWMTEVLGIKRIERSLYSCNQVAWELRF